MLIQEEVKEIYVWEDVQEWQPTDKTFLYINVDGNDTTSVTYDKSGRGNNLERNSIQYVDEPEAGRCLYARKAYADHAIIDSSIGASESGYTVNVWLKYIDYKYEGGFLFYTRPDLYSSAKYGLRFTDSGIFVYTEYIPLTYDGWDMFTFNIGSNGYVSIYQNSKFVATAEAQRIYMNGHLFNMFGEYGTGNSGYYVKEVIVEEKLWSEADIKEHYIVSKGNYGK